MTVDIATLGLAIDSKQVTEGTAALDKFDAAGKRVTATADLVTRQTAQMQTAMQKTAASSNTLKQSQDLVEQAMVKEAVAADKFIFALQRQTEGLGKTKAELMALRAAQLGASEGAAPYIAKLAEMEGAHHNFSFATAQSKRELMVLAHELAQGNFSKFGGSMMVLANQTGAASLLFSALGLSIGATLGTLALFAYAAFKGHEELKHFNDTLTLTGAYSGQTMDSVNGLAKQIGVASGQTGTASKEIALGLMKTGAVSSDVFGQMTDVATLYARKSGEDSDAVVKDFSKMQGGVLQWALQHDQSYHNLDLATYKHIQQLEEEGKTAEATRVLLKSLSDHLGGDAVQDLGYWEKGWTSAKNAILGAWEAMKAVGREKSPGEALAALQGKRKVMTNQGYTSKDFVVQELDAQIANEQERMTIEAAGAATKSLIAEANKKQIEAERNLENFRKMIETKDAGMQRQIAEYKRNAAAVGTSEEQQAKDIAAYKALNADKPKTATDDAATKFLQTLRDQDAAIRAQLASQTKLTGAQKEQIDFEQKLEDFKGKKLTKDQQSLVANQDAIRAQLAKNVADAESLRLKDEIAKLDTKSAQINQEIASFQTNKNEAYGRTLGAFGMGKDAQSQVAELNQIQKEYQKYQDQLTKSTPKELLSSSQFLDEQGKIRDGLTQSLADYRAYYASLKEKQGDWSNGASQAFADYLESAKNVAGQTESLFTNSFKGAEDALTQYIRTGQLSLRSLGDTIIAEIARIQARQIIANASGGSAGWFGSFLSLFRGGSGPSSTVDGVPWTSGYDVGPGKASGGGVNPFSIQEVNERGPELLSSGGKDYLMMGSRGGTVTPNSAVGGKSVVINNAPVFNIQGGVDQATEAKMRQIAQQQNADLVDRLQRAGQL